VGQHETARAHLSQQHLGCGPRVRDNRKATLLESLLNLVARTSLSRHDVEEERPSLRLDAKGSVPPLIGQPFVVYFVQTRLNEVDGVGHWVALDKKV